VAVVAGRSPLPCSRAIERVMASTSARPATRLERKGPGAGHELSLLVPLPPVRRFPLQAHEEPQDEGRPKPVGKLCEIGLHERTALSGKVRE
jgi:hypothetical protein